MNGSNTPQYTIAQLAILTDSQMVGDPNHLISGIASLEEACTQDASFLANLRYKESMGQSQAGVICIPPHVTPVANKNFLISPNPSETFQKLIEIFLMPEYTTSGFSGIHPTATIHPSAKIGTGVFIGPYCVIDQNVSIGDQTQLMALVSIGSGTRIGEQCLLHPHVTVRERCFIGNRVILQPGAVVGSCGFGYLANSSGQHIKLQQLGTVEIEDDVEIGANTTIDRARFKTTRIGKGTKIDNLVQIGHNASLGQNNLIVSQTGISGSVKTGKNVIMGGQAGAVGHIEIADNVMIATRGGVSKSVKQSGKYAGGPLMPLFEYNKQQVHLRHIAHYLKRIEELEQRLDALEKKF